MIHTHEVESSNLSLGTKSYFIKFMKNIRSYLEESLLKHIALEFKNDDIISLDLEDYVVGVVACEMPASFSMEALKAMAVAARTFALYKIKTNKNYKLSTTTKDQCYITKEKMKFLQ